MGMAFRQCSSAAGWRHGAASTVHNGMHLINVQVSRRKSVYAHFRLHTPQAGNGRSAAPPGWHMLTDLTPAQDSTNQLSHLESLLAMCRSRPP